MFVNFRLTMSFLLEGTTVSILLLTLAPPSILEYTALKVHKFKAD